MRTNTFNLFFKMMNQLQENLQRGLVIVETGTIRGDIRFQDGNSTVRFADYVKQYGGTFYSVERDKECVEYSRGVLGEREGVQVVEALSTDFLPSFSDKIDVLYLDSANDENIGLAEYEAAKPKLYDHTIVLIDDCLEGSPAQRKGLLSIPKMINDGYIKILHEYQCVLTKQQPRWDG